jgi:hypothetical protein
MGQAMQEMYSINEDNEEVSLELDETSSLAQQAAIAISEKEHGNKPKKEEVELDEAKYTRKLMKDKSVVDYVKSQQEKNRKRGNTPQDGAVYHGANWVDIAADAIVMNKMSLSKKKAFDWDSEYEAVAKKLGEEVDLDEAEAGIKVQAGHDHDGKVKRIQSLAKQLGAKVTSIGKSTDGKMSTIHVKGSMKVVNDLMKLRTEEVELDEAKMSSAQIAKLKKAYEPMRDKRISTDNANKLNAMMDKVGKDKEALIQLFKADIPFVSQSAVTKLISKHNMKGAEINKLREEFNIESVDLDEGKILVADPKTQKVTKIDEKDWPEYEKKGYVQAEEVDLDEAEDFKPHKMYDPETGKAYDAKTMDDHLKYKKMGYSHEKPEVEESAASDARRAIALDPSTKQKFSKNVSASDDDVKSADKNIMMQMRKAVSLRGNKVEFMDKKKMEIPQKVAQAVLDKYNSQKRPADKEKFQTKVSKSYKDMLQALKETNEKMDTFHEVKSLMRKFRENNNG